jgi:hypothetical protein
MSLIVRINDNLSDCKICVTAGDTANSGDHGVLTILIEGHPPISKSVNLIYPPQLVCFENTPKDGKVHSVKATLVSMKDSNSDYSIISLCNV